MIWQEKKLSMLPNTIDNPLHLLAADQTRAFAAGDPAAGFLTLATANTVGQPAIRTVVIREITPQSLLISSNTDSPKEVDLRENPHYALLIYWSSLNRQYRISGDYQRIAAADMPERYAGCPWRSRVWGWLHEELPQSSVVVDRATFTARFEALAAELEARYGGQDQVPPAPNVGYLRFVPDRVEVQHIDTALRLHDRRHFSRHDALWKSETLVP